MEKDPRNKQVATLISNVTLQNNKSRVGEENYILITSSIHPTIHNNGRNSQHSAIDNGQVNQTEI